MIIVKMRRKLMYNELTAYILERRTVKNIFNLISCYYWLINRFVSIINDLIICPKVIFVKNIRKKNEKKHHTSIFTSGRKGDKSYFAHAKMSFRLS